jgi:flagellar protein FliO/FliZ
MNGALFQAFGGLALIVALMFLGAWLFRRSGGLQALARGPVRLVGGIRVGTRERVLVLEIAETWLVVGVTPGQVTALHTLPRQEGASDALPSAGTVPFPSWLARFAPASPIERPK